MDEQGNINLCEGVPLISPGATNIFLSSSQNRRANNGTVIHLKTEKNADVGVHINTILSIASSKKIKFLIILNFSLSVICMIISCSVAFYYFNEIISTRKQIEIIQEQFLIQNFEDDVIEQNTIAENALVNTRLRPQGRVQSRKPHKQFTKQGILPNVRRNYVEHLEEDLLLIDSTKKYSQNKTPVIVHNISTFEKELLVVHFNGAMREVNMGARAIIGPWLRDMEASSKDSENRIEIHNNYVTVKESGIYLVYAQVVYLTHAPNCYFIWARQPAQEPRLLSTCATGDESSSRSLDKSQISCATQTVARLYKGDSVNLAQREQNRTLWLRSGCSYFGFIKISS